MRGLYQLVCVVMLLSSMLAHGSGTCGICFEEKAGGANLGCSTHLCCTACAQAFAKSELSFFRRSEIGCYERSCPTKLTRDEVISLTGTKAVDDFELKRNQGNRDILCNNSQCKKKDQVKLVLGPLHSLIENRLELQCPSCKALTCLICQEKMPLKNRKGKDNLHDCSTLTDRLLREKLENQDHEVGIKPCPYCFTLVERVNGCPKMKCDQCGADFCWRCLSKGWCDQEKCPAWVAEYCRKRNARLAKLMTPLLEVWKIVVVTPSRIRLFITPVSSHESVVSIDEEIQDFFEEFKFALGH